jgi:ABC-type nitrate/sulfonate/bicarbonate transport system permease component
MSRKSGAILYPAILFVILLAIWQYLSSAGFVDPWILPSPLKVLSVFKEAPALLWFHSKFTLIYTLTGFAISIVLGILTAILMDMFSGIRKALYPYLIISQTIPIIAVAPILIIWFGYGISSKIFTVVLVCFFPIALNFGAGLANVNIEQIRLLKSMGASNWQIFRHLKTPSALPDLFTGLKLAATYSVMGAVIGEWLGGNGGLGIFMTRASKSYLIHYVFAILVVIIVLSMALFLLINTLERLLIRWSVKHKEEYLDPSD